MSVEVFEYRADRARRKAYAVADACNALHARLQRQNLRGTIIGYEVATLDQNAEDYLAEKGDWAIDVIYAEREA